jgi:hypothetical protein
VYGKSAERVADAAVDVQDLLGDHQDGIVNTQRIHEAIDSVATSWAAETAMALGQVVQRELQHGEKVRRRFKAAYRDVESAWRRLRHAF